MSPVAVYRTATDLPHELPVFPLTGALLLPRAHLPLNIFEPRYIAMIDHAMHGDRLIGMVQPLDRLDETALRRAGGKPALYRVGCAGRITAYAETPDGRYIITLSGISRFRIVEELERGTPFRMVQADFASFRTDLLDPDGEAGIDRKRLLAAFRHHVESRNMEADWQEVERASCETLVNTFAAICGFRGREMQAVLEADDLAARAETVIALADMDTGATPAGPLQ